MEIKKTAPCSHCCDSDDDGCAQHIYRGHNCPYCKGTLRMPVLDEQHVEDYAVRAAREWFAPEKRLTCIHGEHCEQCNAIRESMEQNLQQLAAIIRRHAAPLHNAARCAMADLEGIMPEFEPSGDRQHPAWKTLKELKALLPE